MFRPTNLRLPAKGAPLAKPACVGDVCSGTVALVCKVAQITPCPQGLCGGAYMADVFFYYTSNTCELLLVVTKVLLSQEFSVAWRPSGPTQTPSWGHSRFVLGAIGSFLEPFCGHLSPKMDKVSEKLTLRYPHEGPCVAMWSNAPC